MFAGMIARGCAFVGLATMMIESDASWWSVTIGTAALAAFAGFAPFGRKRSGMAKPTKPQQGGVSATPAAAAYPAAKGLTTEFRADKPHEALLRPPPPVV